jgi:catechol 2,3-dioxygenase-like lactoylglutathione lyase family enzyme
MAIEQQNIERHLDVQVDREGLRSPFGALHHVALITNDMEKTVAFYRDVLGSEVALAHRLGRPDNARHYFITVAPNTVFAFFEFPDAELPAYKGATLPTTGRALDHIAFYAESVESFHDWHRRLTEAGVDNLSPIRELGPGTLAFFFSDPNGIVLELMSPPPATGMGYPLLDDPEPAW